MAAGRWVIGLWCWAGCAALAGAAEPLLVTDFESGVGGWQRVEGTRPPEVAQLASFTATADTAFGAGAGRLQFLPLPGTWAHVQLAVQPADWVGVACDALRLQIKGDGSGEPLNVMLGNYELRPPLAFRASVPLDFTGWREVTLPFEQFQPAGLAQALRQIVLLQLNATNTTKPIDVVVDEIVARPGPGAPPDGLYHDLEVLPAGGWDTPSPGAPVVVDPLAGLAPGVTLPRTVHGVRNHRDLHNPTEIQADYAADGSFAVNIGDTSGYGGSRLLVAIDGREVLRQDFPGTTETALTQYRGWYTVPVPAGRHTLRVDNDGADWYTVEAYRFGNYLAVGARVRRQDHALEVRFSRPEDAAGLSLAARVAGRELPLSEAAPGRYDAGLPTDVVGEGVYPVAVTGSRDGKVVFRRDLRVRLSGPRLRALRIAWPKDQPVELAVRYANRADVPLAGRKLTARFGARSLPLTDQGDGTYTAGLGPLPVGVHSVEVTADDLPPRELRLVVHDPTQTAGDGVLIRLGADGWFRAREGRAFLPWGYATNGIFLADADLRERPAGPGNWNAADDRALLDWLALLRAHGVNCVRFGVNVDSRGIGGDRGGQADPAVLDRLAALLDVLGSLNLRAVPVFWWGHYRNFSFQGLPAYDALIQKQADWFTNPQALALQQAYVRQLVTRFKGDPRILAWEVMNETYRAGGDLDAAVAWTNAIVDTVREIDPDHLITTSAAEATPGAETRWMRGARIDFFNWHAYPTYPDYSSWRALVGGPREIGLYAAVMAKCQRLGGKPSILGEAGNDRVRELSYPEMRALITRDCLWLAFLNGSPGGITWDAIADLREVDVLSRLTEQVAWPQVKLAPAPVAVRVADVDQDLPDLVEYTAWSLRSGVPVQFLGPDEPAAADQVVLPTDFLAPTSPPRPPVTVSAGYENAWVAAADGSLVLAYLRNVGEVLPQNVRLRTARTLWIRVPRTTPATVEVWDLDTRQRVAHDSAPGPFLCAPGATDHDFAVLVRQP